MNMQGKKWSTPERERQVIELYSQYESAIKVATIVGCGRTTVNNILVQNGIPRVGRHHGNGRQRKPRSEPKVKKSHCRTKYCPALIVMLNRQLGYCATEISNATGYKENGVRNVLAKRGFVEKKRKVRKNDLDLDKIQHEYATLNIPGRQLDKKYGLSEGTVQKWMSERGIHLGKGAHQEGRKNGDAALRHKQAEIAFAKRLHDEFNGRFEYVRGFRENDKKFATIRCTECGHEFEHYIGFQGVEWVCPRCRQRQREEVEQERDARRYERMLDEIREYALEKTCKECGSTFHSKHKSALYCSDRCRRRTQDRKRKRLPNNFRHYYHAKYGDGYRDYYDPSITLKKLYERDGGICQICGEPCDWDDKQWGCNGPSYPSIDHIVPRSSGGAHHWDNVQLAHCMCNSYKRDLANDEAVELMACG